jgi:hypothetical protein
MRSEPNLSCETIVCLEIFIKTRNSLNPLKPSGCYMYKLMQESAFYINWLYMVLRTKSDYFLKQH